MKIVHRSKDGERELDLEYQDQSATLAELCAVLTGRHPDPADPVFLDGQPVAAGTALIDVALRQGAVLTTDPDLVPPAEPSGPAELHVVGGRGAGMRVPLAAGRHVVGRGEDCDVRLPSATVSARHLTADVDSDGRVTITDLGSRNGTKVDGEFALKPTEVHSDAVVQLGAVQLRLRPVPDDDRQELDPPRPNGTIAFNRPPPRPAPKGPEPLDVPVDPGEPQPSRPFGWAAILAPIVMGVVLALVWSPFMLAFGGFAVVMVGGNWVEDKRRVRRERKRNAEQLAADLERLAGEVADAKARERRRRRAELPDVVETARRAQLPATSLWERRTGHRQFMQLSLGLGEGSWSPPQRGRNPNESAAPDVMELLEAHAELDPVPVEADLAAGRVLGVVGDRGWGLGVARSLLVQAAVHHGCADVGVVVLTQPDREADWDWVKWLPHALGASGQVRVGVTPDEVDGVLEALLTVDEDAETAPPVTGMASLGGDAAPAAREPVTLVVVDVDGLTEGRGSPARSLLRGEGQPVAGVVLTRSAERLPSMCTQVLTVHDDNGVADVAVPGDADSHRQLLLATLADADARRVARRLSAYEDPEVSDAAAALPDVVTLLGLLDLTDCAPDRLAERWARAEGAARLSAPVGLSESGPFQLDLVRDGPHGLVGGTTGSGKSELLRSVVASLAATASPEQLTFMLVDYKGGSAFDVCAHLPHTVGLVTDLDEHLGQRALTCLEAELGYREQVLREAGVQDLPEYLRLRRRRPDLEAMPRLVVVIDEFATLAAELPDFVDSLVGVAQRGRSLGVHLVLATQRPSGAVSDNIRANTNIRIALRVQNKADSNDVIDSPAAAKLARAQPGRALARLGPGELVEFQSCLVTAASSEDAGSRIEVRPLRLRPAPSPAPSEEPEQEAPSDLSRLVDAAQRTFAGSGLAAPRRPWPEPLPTWLPLDALDGAVAEAPPWTAVFGLVDEPHRQRQRPATWSLTDGHLMVVGVPGSGTTTALTTLGASLARAHRPDDLHLYALDFGTRALAALEGLPHTGAVVGPNERERQERLVAWLRDEVDRRRDWLAADGRASVRPGPQGQAPPLPGVVVLVDNVAGFVDAFDDVAGTSVVEAFTRVVADGPAVGIFAALAADRPGAVPMHLSNLVPTKLALRLADPFDYANFGLKPKDIPELPPGRAVQADSGLHVQLAVPGDDRARVDGAAPAPAADRAPVPISTLPAEVGVDAVVDAVAVDGEEWFLPLGMGYDDLRPAGLVLTETDHALVAGPAKSGKSTALAVAAHVAAAGGVPVTAVCLRRSPLRDSPAVTTLVTDLDDLGGTVDALGEAGGPHLLVVDDAELVDDAQALPRLISARVPHVHILAAGRIDALRSAYGHWSQQVRASRLGLVLKPNVQLDGELFQTALPRHGPRQYPAGRGYLVAEGIATLLQTAMAPTAPPAALSAHR